MLRLLGAGMSREEAPAKAACLAELGESIHAFEGRSDGASSAYWVPGRIEFLGKHTDYAGGRSLLCATERGICLCASERPDRRLRMRDARTGEDVECSLDPDLVPPAGDWRAYPMTVARRIARDFRGDLRGADIIFASDLPPAAGLSSSSALIVATFLALADINHLTSRIEYRRSIHTIEELAGYLGAVESGQRFGALAEDLGVGTAGGSEDHTAILCARAGALVQYAFCPVRFERSITLPRDCCFVIATSGVRAEKTGGARERYNQAALAVQAILDCWRHESGRDDATLASALASSADAPDRLRGFVGKGRTGAFTAEDLVRRLEHFLTEDGEIIPATADALQRGSLDRAGVLVDRSQASAESLLGNQVPETTTLASTARALGAAAASSFGAGFGGSVWALVRANDAAIFQRRWLEAYASRCPEYADRVRAFSTRAGPAAIRLGVPEP